MAYFEINHLHITHHSYEGVRDVLKSRHRELGRKQVHEEAVRLLQEVKLADAKSTLRKYPHQLSGGQRQRIAIARSLASNPKLVVLDESTSSIDVFSQAQILELIRDLRRRFQLTNILISHDLGVVHELANKIAIMYLGKVVEFGPADEIFHHPRHPYTRALFDSIPTLTTRGMEGLKTLEGQIPSPISPPPEEEIKKYARLKETEESFYILCMRQLERFLGKEVAAVISTELGGSNTATALYVGAMTDRCIVDGDPAGRSVPALQHSTYFLKGVPMCPMSVMNRFGEGAVFTNVFDDERGEDMVRALAVVSQNTIAVMDHVNTAKVLKDAVIRGAISHAESIGKAFLSAKAAGGDYVKAVTEAGGGKSMFEGRVTGRMDDKTRTRGFRTAELWV